jgi:hypothetical protein
LQNMEQVLPNTIKSGKIVVNKEFFMSIHDKELRMLLGKPGEVLVVDNGTQIDFEEALKNRSLRNQIETIGELAVGGSCDDVTSPVDVA